MELRGNSLSGLLPERAFNSDFGLDIVASNIQWINPYLVKYDTDFYFEGHPALVCLVLPRSSIKNTKLILSNSVGLIDPDYRGNLMFYFRRNINWFVALLERLIPKFAKYNRERDSYKIGDKIGQLLFVPYAKVDFVLDKNLSRNTGIRGTNGFGSTGK